MTKKTNSEKQTDENLVYQYLPFSSFIKMIENKTIKLSNIRRSNDTTELDYGRDVFKEVIFNTLTKRNDITDKNKEIFINNFNEKVKHLDDINEKYIHGQFVSCFSNNGDLLSQWRGYSQEIETSRNYLVSMLENEKRDTFVLNGVFDGGVSVGFSKDFIDKVTNANTDLLSSGKVQYTRRYQTKFFKDSTTKIINSYKKCLNDKSDINQFWIDVQIEYEDILIKDAPYIKNPFFKEEKEYRICHWGSFIGIKKYNLNETSAYLSNEFFISNYNKYTNDLPKKNNAEKVEEANINDMFFFIHMGNDVNKYIKRVIIGPRCKHSKEEIERLLVKQDIQCTIDYSAGYGKFIDSQNQQ